MGTNGNGIAQREDLLALAKGVHDKLHDSLDRRMKSLQQENLLQTGQVLERGLSKLVKKLEAVSKELTDKDGEYHKEIAAIRKEMNDRLEALEKGLMEGLKGMVEAVKAIPTPTIGVTIPESAILIQQVPSQVDVHLPEMAPTINLPQLSPVVNVPELSPVFNMPQLSPVFQVPEQQSIVHVNVPKPRRVEKLFSYDQHGRPERVREEEIKEE